MVAAAARMECRGAAGAAGRAEQARLPGAGLPHHGQHGRTAHRHASDHLVYVLEGELLVGDRFCPRGTLVVLEVGAKFGPLIAGIGRKCMNPFRPKTVKIRPSRILAISCATLMDSPSPATRECSPLSQRHDKRNHGHLPSVRRLAIIVANRGGGLNRG